MGKEGCTSTTLEFSALRSYLLGDVEQIVPLFEA